MKAGIARILTVLAALSLAALPAAGKDNLLASPYGPVVVDLLFAFHATEVPCLGPVDISDVCFTANPATAGALAEVLETVVAGYGSAGLRGGEWRAANGVWAVDLVFGDGVYGALEVYLTEVQRAEVHGKVVLRSR
jgi:hypothetical protein